MPVIDFLERNVKLYGNETALVELNPEIKETRRMTWKEYDLIQPTTDEPYRREITWNVFNEKANRFANMLLSRGVKKGDKVAILMYNCLEWLPIYFGILKTTSVTPPRRSNTAPTWRRSRSWSSGRSSSAGSRAWPRS